MAILLVISRRLVLQHEASFVNTAVLRGVGRFVVVLFPFTAARQMIPSPLDIEGIIRRLAAEVAGACDRHVRRSARSAERVEHAAKRRARYSPMFRRRRCRETM
jgi:hypothetical protein